IAGRACHRTAAYTYGQRLRARGHGYQPYGVPETTRYSSGQYTAPTLSRRYGQWAAGGGGSRNAPALLEDGAADSALIPVASGVWYSAGACAAQPSPWHLHHSHEFEMRLSWHTGYPINRHNI